MFKYIMSLGFIWMTMFAYGMQDGQVKPFIFTKTGTTIDQELPVSLFCGNNGSETVLIRWQEPIVRCFMNSRGFDTSMSLLFNTLTQEDDLDFSSDTDFDHKFTVLTQAMTQFKESKEFLQQLDDSFLETEDKPLRKNAFGQTTPSLRKLREELLKEDIVAVKELSPFKPVQLTEREKQYIKQAYKIMMPDACVQISVGHKGRYGVNFISYQGGQDFGYGLSYNPNDPEAVDEVFADGITQHDILEYENKFALLSNALQQFLQHEFKTDDVQEVKNSTFGSAPETITYELEIVGNEDVPLWKNLVEQDSLQNSLLPLSIDKPEHFGVFYPVPIIAPFNKVFSATYQMWIDEKTSIKTSMVKDTMPNAGQCVLQTVMFDGEIDQEPSLIYDQKKRFFEEDCFVACKIKDRNLAQLMKAYSEQGSYCNLDLDNLRKIGVHFNSPKKLSTSQAASVVKIQQALQKEKHCCEQDFKAIENFYKKVELLEKAYTTFSVKKCEKFRLENNTDVRVDHYNDDLIKVSFIAYTAKSEADMVGIARCKQGKTPKLYSVLVDTKTDSDIAFFDTKHEALKKGLQCFMEREEQENELMKRYKSNENEDSIE